MLHNFCKIQNYLIFVTNFESESANDWLLSVYAEGTWDKGGRCFGVFIIRWVCLD